jgi:hypothetical protein
MASSGMAASRQIGMTTVSKHDVKQRDDDGQGEAEAEFFLKRLQAARLVTGLPLAQ